MHASVLSITLAAISIFSLILLAVMVFRLRRFDLVFIYISGKSISKLRIKLPLGGVRSILLHKSEPYGDHEPTKKKRQKDQSNIKRFISKHLKEITDISGGTFRLISELLESESSKIHLACISIESRIGTGDPALTGFVCGLAYAAAGTIFSWIVEKYGGNIGKVSVEPCYDAKAFDIRIIGIFKARIIHIIVLIARYAYRYLKNILKTGGGYFGTSNRRAYEDGNGEHQRYG